MQDAKTRRRQLKLARDSVFLARVDLALEDMGIKRLQRRILKKGLKLLPKELHEIFTDYMWEFGFRPRHRSDLPFRAFEMEAVRDERTYLKQLRAELPRDKYEEARRRLKQAGPARILRQLRPAFEDLKYEYITEMALLALPLIRGPSILQRCLNDTKGPKRAFLAALARSDLRFFQRVGNVLSKKQIHFGLLHAQFGTKLQRFLIIHWASEEHGLPPLYIQPIKILHQICQIVLDNSNLTASAVEKNRQRLGLLAFRKD
jgi:hypothetical protein